MDQSLRSAVVLWWLQSCSTVLSPSTVNIEKVRWNISSVARTWKTRTGSWSQLRPFMVHPPLCLDVFSPRASTRYWDQFVSHWYNMRWKEDTICPSVSGRTIGDWSRSSHVLFLLSLRCQVFGLLFSCQCCLSRPLCRRFCQGFCRRFTCRGKQILT